MKKRHFITFLYNSENERLNWGRLISIATVIAVFSAFIHFNNNSRANAENERAKFKKYTVGTTTAEHNNIKGSLVVDFEYIFAGSTYSNSASTKNWLIGKPKTQGGRYYVEFAYNNPSNSIILFNYSVPDTITTAPDSGWEYMPGYEIRR